MAAKIRSKVVAVAGGTGGVGKTIVEELQKAGKYRILVLTRSPPKESSKQAGIEQVEINYDDVTSMVKLLQEREVDTVISTIGLVSDEISKSQLNLIEAAEKSAVTKRFIPSEYGIVFKSEHLGLDPSGKWWIDAADALKHSGLQYTRFGVGFLMDYWGMPHAKTNLAPFSWAVDMVNCRAALPGDGSDVLSFTYSYDVAKLVTKILEMDDWPESTYFVGEDITWNDFLEIAERVRGKKFEVTYDSEEDLKKGEVTMCSEFDNDEVAAMMKQLCALFGVMSITGVLKMPAQNRMNDKFPDIRPTGLEEFLSKAWKGR